MTLSQGPWAPYKPSPTDPWDLRKVAHLHRRAGWGATQAELQRDLQAGPAASVERFRQPRPPSSEETQILDSLRQGVLDSRDAERLKAWWLYRILYDPRPAAGKDDTVLAQSFRHQQPQSAEHRLDAAAKRIAPSPCRRQL